MGPQKLAELLIEFTLEGVDKVHAALAQVQTGLAGLGDGAKKIGNLAEQALGPLSAFIKQWGNLSGASVLLGGFIRQGMNLSVMSDQLNLHMQRLALAIAGLFRPEIEAVIERVRQLASWFENLSDKQRANLVHWIKMGATGLIVATLLPKVMTGLNLVVGGVKLLTAGFAAMGVASGGILPLIGMVATVLAGIGAASAEGEEGMGGLSGMFSGLMEKIKPIFEALKPLFEAIADLAKQVFEAVAPFLGDLVDLFVQMVQIAAPVITRLVELISKLLEALMPVISAVTGLAVQVVQALMPAFDAVANILQVVMNIFEPFIPLIQAVADILVTVLVPALEDVVEVLDFMAKLLKAVTLGLVDLTGGRYQVKHTVKHHLEDQGDRTPAPKKSSGIEALASTWDRLATAAVSVGGKVGKSPEEEAVDLLKQIAENTGGTEKAVGRIKPAFGQ